MFEWLQSPLVAAACGALFTLFVQGFTQHLIYKRAARLAERAEAFEKQKEQKELARDLQMRIERHCLEVAARQSRGVDSPSHFDDALARLREEIVSRAEGLMDPVARKHLTTTIGTALWWVRDPPWPVHTSPWPIKLAGRAVLGAIQRGEAVPMALPMLDGVCNTAAEWESEMEAQAEAQKEYAREERERKLEKSRQRQSVTGTTEHPAAAPPKPAVRVAANGPPEDSASPSAEEGALAENSSSSDETRETTP